jgi:hypothetical protein
MKLLALEREITGESETFQPFLKAEAVRVWELYQSGLLREVYFRADQHTAVLVLECMDEAAARDILDTLPLVKAGLIMFDIIPLVPYSGFARLFNPE